MEKYEAMANPFYTTILNEMGKVLKLSRRSLEFDIKSITEHWENCLTKADTADRETAICLLTACVDCYLRGRGISLGSQKELDINRDILVSLVTLIYLYAWKEPGNNFTKIRELMPLHRDVGPRKRPGLDILREAEKILRNYN
jgi:hypothetical protein